MIAALRLSDLDIWLNVSMFVVLVAAALLVGRSRARDSTISAQMAELDAREKTEERLREEVKQLRGELQTRDVKYSEDIARLQGQVTQLSEQNAYLQSLVMGTTVPEAMRAALTDAVETGAARNREFYADLLRPIQQQLDRLLTAGGEER